MDYEEGDRWDWDPADETQYCEHGTFIGSWWGPDILCQYCEDGMSQKEVLRLKLTRAEDDLRKVLKTIDEIKRIYPTDEVSEYFVAKRRQFSQEIKALKESIYRLRKEKART